MKTFEYNFAWTWDVQNETCAICRSSLMELSPNVSVSLLKNVAYIYIIFRTRMVMLLFGVNVVIRFTIPVCRFGRKIILDVLFANKIGLLPVLPDDFQIRCPILSSS